jgi:hypothetical protein
MSEESKKDYSVFYIAAAALISVVVIVAVKMEENEKFAPIKQQLEEEATQMNIRVISTTE